MALLQLNLAEITRARADLAALQEQKRRALAQHRQATVQLETMRRSGADARVLARQQQRVTRLAQSVRAATLQVTQSLQTIRQLSARLATTRNPALMVNALAATHPVLLMPVSVQTRYDDATTRLMIRIYPDVLHGYTHDPGLTAAEITEGKLYWTQRYANPADATSPWTQIARSFGPSRAAYVVQTLAPTNVAEIGQASAPVFDEAAIPLAASQSPPMYARALPTRFVAIGLRGDTEIFRKWGNIVSDQLALSPLFDPLLMEDPNNTDPFAGDRAWLINYDAAVTAGMGITVTQSDLRAGARMRDGVPRLIVLGVDWTQTPQSGSELVATLLDNHLHSAGLKFVAQGTPTNNTSSTRAGFAANGADVVAALEPTTAATTSAAVADELDSAGARAQLLLGLPKPGVDANGNPLPGFDAGLVPGADLQEGASAAHMLNALWNATLGYTLRFFWNPLDTSQTLLEDSDIEQLRAHGVRYLRASGPLSALRVGKAPFGILPITARGYKPKANSPLERELSEAIDWFRLHWEFAVDQVPTLKDPSAESLHQVLAMQPWALAKRFWQVVGPAAVKNYPDIEPFAAWQGLFLHLLVASLLDKQPFSVKAPFLSTCAVRPKSHSLDAVPWVQRDPDHPRQEMPPEKTLTPNYIQALLQLLSLPKDQFRNALIQMQDAESLLAAMLAFAADEETQQSARGLFLKFIALRPGISAAAKQQAKRLRPAEYVGVDVATPFGDQFDIGHAKAVLGLNLAGDTNNQTVEAFIGSHFGQVTLNWPEQLQNIASFNQSLTFLKNRTVGELTHAFKTTLDLYAHRLDAWITSLATKRLDEMREQAPQGLHIGAFGVVEDLLPDSVRPADQSADSLGYVHAPSLQQAATAAILRSGHLANRQAADSAFNIDLRSKRVKRAKRLLEGVANGQSMAALLGYRFERALRDKQLSQHILELRRAYPLMPAGTKATSEAKEAISARNAIDGVRLVDEYKKGGINPILAATDPPLILPPAERNTIARIIDDLIDQLDSTADLLLAESVFQIAGGNMDGAGAAMMTLDRQLRPPDTRVADTPHSTRGYTQRVVVALQSEQLAPSWVGVADNDLAAQLEPRLNVWLARLLGDSANYVFGAKVFEAVFDTSEPPKIVSWADTGVTLQATFAELGLSPLALVLGSEAQKSGGQSAVQERIGAVMSAKARVRPGAQPEREAIVLQGESQVAGKHGLVAFESFAWLLRRLLEKARALRRMDLVQAVDGIETDALLNDGEFAGVDLPDLLARLQIAEVPAQSAITALATAIAPVPTEADVLAALDPAAQETIDMLDALHAALGEARALGWRSALPSERIGANATGETQGERVTPADTVALAVARAKALLAEVSGRLTKAPAPAATDSLAKQAQAALHRIRAIVGASFPLLPRFTLGAYAADAAATLGDRATLLNGDDFALSGWLPKLGCVRPATGLLSDVLTAADAMGQASAPSDLKLLQFPRSATARWGALPPAPDQDLRGVVAVVAHAPAALATVAPNDALAGLFIDEWSESIPIDHETTGLGFHFDAPGARPPQSMLLAVPADPAAQNWTLTDLIGVVNEAMSLGRLRAVRPQDLQGMGLMLPGIFLSNNYKRDVASLDFAGLLDKNLATLRAAYGQNTTQSFMHMAEGTTKLFE